jgi:hypothetical protein
MSRYMSATRASFILLALISLAPPLSAQCQPGAAILAPTDPGQIGQTREGNLLTLVNDLYQSPATSTITVSGSVLEVPPWFTSSTDCTIYHTEDLVGAPSSTNYLVVTDELSELAIVTAVADSDDRMLAIHNTIQKLVSGSAYQGLPCWKAQVSQGQISCRTTDVASDADARFGLAYYLAAANPRFPASSRAMYRAAGDALASAHLELEYASGCFTSGVSQRTLCSWIAGGGRTASGGVGSLEMWIGYHADIARFLIAASMSTGDPAYLQRAEDVVDQWLMASTFAGGSLTVGRFSFGWATGNNPIQPNRPSNDPQAQQFWDHDPAWDDSDAPRALWMGDVLRALQLSTGAVPSTGPYATLLDWVGKMQAADSQTPNFSCIQFNQNGAPLSSNCGHDYYYNGLGVGLHTYLNTAGVQPKLDEALGQFGWNGPKQTWNNTDCFGIYRGIRPVKALASAIGLDAGAYACTASQCPPGLSLTCASPAVACIPAGVQSAVVSYAQPTMAGNCGRMATPTCSPPSGSAFHLGSTAVGCSVAFNPITASCSFTQVVASIPDAAITTPASVTASSTGNVAAVPDAGSGSTYTWSIANGSISAGGGTRQISFTAGASGAVTLEVQIQSSAGCANSGSVAVPITGLSFYTLAPCRVVDTRTASGPYGGPALQGGIKRSFAISGQCGIPSDAQAVVMNVTVVGPTAAGDLIVYPSAANVPAISTVNFLAGAVRANNAVLGLSGGFPGSIDVMPDMPSGSTAQLLIDVDGYFK